MDSYVIRHGMEPAPEEMWLGSVGVGYGHEDLILDMIRKVTGLQKRDISVFNTAVILPEDNHVWRILLQAAARERTTNIGAYVLNRDLALKALLNL